MQKGGGKFQAQQEESHDKITLNIPKNTVLRAIFWPRHSTPAFLAAEFVTLWSRVFEFQRFFSLQSEASHDAYLTFYLVTLWSRVLAFHASIFGRGSPPFAERWRFVCRYLNFGRTFEFHHRVCGRTLFLQSEASHDITFQPRDFVKTQHFWPRRDHAWQNG